MAPTICNKVLFSRIGLSAGGHLPFHASGKTGSQRAEAISPERTPCVQLPPAPRALLLRCKTPLFRLKGSRECIGNGLHHPIARIVRRWRQPLQRASDPLDGDEEHLAPAILKSGANHAEDCISVVNKWHVTVITGMWNRGHFHG
jgi:hypothetical protein